MELVRRRAVVPRVRRPPALDAADPLWTRGVSLPVDRFHSESTDHRPRTELRLLYDEVALYGAFEVDDRWVRAVAERYQDPVYRDSCVELFLAPRRTDGTFDGYFNLELNAGGTMLLSHVRDPRRTGDGFADFHPVPWTDASRIRVRSSLPRIVDPEIAGPVRWTLHLVLPFTVLEPHVGPISRRPGETWRANAFKCADATSRPHWASWSPVGPRLDFHQPDRFGVLELGEDIGPAPAVRGRRAHAV